MHQPARAGRDPRRRGPSDSLRGPHPPGGEIGAVASLKVPEPPGLAATLSRAVRSGLGEDFPRLTAAAHADVRLPSGALRHPVLHEAFAPAIGRLPSEGPGPA